MRKKISILFLATLLILSSGFILQIRAYASTAIKSEVVIPFYKYISVLGATLTIGDAGKSISGGYVYYSGNYDSTLTIELQRFNGTSWSVVKSWSESFSGRGYHSFEKEYYVTSGTYRVVTTATIRNGNRVLETASSTSAQVTY